MANNNCSACKCLIHRAAKYIAGEGKSAYRAGLPLGSFD